MAKTYNVHMFTVVRVKVVNVEAENHIEAMEKVDKQVDFNSMFRDVARNETEWGEEHSHVLIDEVGDDQYEKSTWYNGDLKTKMKWESKHIKVTHSNSK